ncbi:ubiquitin hydrolase [Niveomyces insectorum RCEF 264]|uniref:Ubiquitin carboxyl-terminal hydrolase n=1 Tax=Niveomyces insectorum RCEF 264 TaxID=1081102 RepID=A0A167TVN3_9HYPO|nr:ubiquitin hydrolase [Niveomyces insectorum RCEF 264]
MSSFFNKLKPGVAAANAANNVSPNKKKDEAALEITPLEKMLQNAGPLRADGTDKFLGLENFGNTCYCNSIVQALYHSEPFRENLVRFPPYSPADTPDNDGTPRRVKVQIRPPMSAAAAAGTEPNAPGTGGATGPAATNKKPPPGQPFKQRQPLSPGNPLNGQAPVRPEDKPDSPEYKKKQAMIKGPVLELVGNNASAYGMNESTFTSLKDIFMAFIESESRTGVLSPLRLLEIFRRENDMFRTAMHQDAHEFYGLVLNDIIKNVEETTAKRLQNRDESNGLKESVVAALGNGSASEPSTQMQTTSDGTTTPGSGWVHDIFEGVLTSETRCLTCETASQRDETFLDLSIDLEEHSSVTSCLRKFSAEEMLCERNKFHCDNCGGLQEAEKRMKIKRLPKILALHLKRFKYAEDYTKLEKLFHRVVYPYQLRMFNTTDDAQDPDRLYELYAVVVHIGGNAYHGHYVSVIKTKERGWLLFDDEMVEPVDKHYVRNFFGDKPGTACAYVLFYQETTFEKMQAEQELEGLEEIRLASQSAGLGLSPEGQMSHANGLQNGGLSRQNTQPAAFSAIDDRDELVNLEHAKSAPGGLLTPISSVPQVPPVPEVVMAVPAVTAPPADETIAKTKAEVARLKENAKAELARSKEEKEREKKEAKAAEKARKAQEKENAKELERQRKERDAQRKAEAEELRRVLAASKQSAAEEKEARKNSIDPASSNGKSAGFLSRSGRGSKSMSRKSFSFLNKDKDQEKLREKDKLGAPYANGHATTGDGSVHGSSSTSSTQQLEPLVETDSLSDTGLQPLLQSDSQPLSQPLSRPSPRPSPHPPSQPQAQQNGEKQTGKSRFSFNLGRRKSSGVFP